MSKFNQGDVVIATLPNKGKISTSLTVITQTDYLATCLYINSEGEPVGVVLPIDWLELQTSDKEGFIHFVDIPVNEIDLRRYQKKD